jgi:hypothetical protein
VDKVTRRKCIETKCCFIFRGFGCHEYQNFFPVNESVCRDYCDLFRISENYDNHYDHGYHVEGDRLRGRER